MLTREMSWDEHLCIVLQGKGKGKKDAVVGYFINAGFLIVNFLFVSSYY